MIDAALVIINPFSLNGVKTYDFSWLVTKLMLLGVSFKQVTFISDNVDDIISVFSQLDAQGIKLLVILGGFEFDSDDTVIEAISKFTGQPRQFDAQLYDLLKNRYSYLFSKGLLDFPEMSDERREKAMIPPNETLIENVFGFMPALIFNAHFGNILLLPSEKDGLKAFFDDNLHTELEKLLLSPVILTKNFKTTIRDKTILTPLFKQLKRLYPHLKIDVGNHNVTTQEPMPICLTVSSASEKKAKEILEQAGQIILIGINSIINT